MIIEESEVLELERFVQRKRRRDAQNSESYKVPSWAKDPLFFTQRPHLLLPLGFDDVRILKIRPNEPVDPYLAACDPDNFALFEYEMLYRHKASGAWYWLDGLGSFRKATGVEDGYHVHFVGPSKADIFRSIKEYLEILHDLARTPDPNRHAVLMPSLWTPHVQTQQRILLADVVPDLLKTLYLEKKALDQISWRTLEQIVAELLRSFGLEILLTPGSRDGGRDVIARGELIPGEPMTLAVEVKQKPVVGIADVQRALRANEDFPALLVATAGTFSAGVVREHEMRRNQLRLFLKDGLALRQWIDIYGVKRGWRNHTKRWPATQP